MKVLVVCRWHGTHAAAFIMEQVDALRTLGHNVEYCCATKGGLMGYVELFRKVRKVLKGEDRPDIIHAHYGICGFVACLASRSQKSEVRSQNLGSLNAESAKHGLKTESQRHYVPVITTYPGSDINSNSVRPISRMCMRMSAYNIFMSKRQIAKVADLAKPEKTQILRYGIMLDLFQSMDKLEARKLFAKAKPDEVQWSNTDKYVLFSSKFNRPVKDPDLAKSVIAQVNNTLNAKRSTLNVHLLPLTGGYTKQEMVWLMNAVDAAIVTSKTEGSPQFTKEVMACGTPIVSVDVGDVAEQFSISEERIAMRDDNPSNALIANRSTLNVQRSTLIAPRYIDGCYVAKTREVDELAELLLKAVNYGKTNGHQHIVDMCLSNEQIAQKLIEIYKSVVSRG